MRIKTQPSTAVLLSEYRDKLRTYYASQRAPKPANRFKPTYQHLPSIAHSFAAKIEAEETKIHEQEMERIEKYNHHHHE